MEQDNLANNDELKKWTKTAQSNNERLDRIYKNLCECDEMISAWNEEDETQKILELLDMINNIQSKTKNLLPATKEMQENTHNLKDQIRMLEDMLNLVHLNQTEEEIMKNQLKL